MAKQNKGRKFFAASATAALVASAIVPVASAAQLNDFNKISGYAKEAVQSLVDAGVIQGDANGNFNPLKTISRAEAATIFTNALELEAEGDVNFKDVKADAWYYDAIAATVENGIFEGVSATEFAPNKQLTRSEAAKILVDAFELEGEGDLSEFADASTVKPWAKSYLEIAVANGVIKGSEANGKTNLNPNAPITRQDFAVVFSRTIENVDATPKVDKIEVVDAKTLNVTLSDGTKETVTLEKALEPNKETEVTFKIKDVEYKAKVTYVVTTATAVKSVSATNLKEAVIEFDGKVDKATATDVDNYEIKGKVLKTATLSEDGKSVTLTLDTAKSTAFANQVEQKLTFGNVKAGDKEISVKDYKFTPVDSTIPTVSEVKALGNKTLSVKFSEPVKAANTNNFTIDGKPVVGEVKVNGNNVIVKLYTSLEDGEHTVAVKDVTDFADFKSLNSEHKFNVVKDVTAPSLSSVEKATFEKVTIKFSEQVDPDTVTTSSAYWLQGTSKKYPTAVTQISDDTFEFDFSNNKIQYTTDLYVTGVKDYSSNVIAADAKIQVNPVVDQTRPEVSSLVYDAKTKELAIKFNKGLDKETAEKAANYVIKDTDGKVVSKYKTPTLSSTNSKEVKVQLVDGLTAGKTYTVEVSGVSDNTTLKNVMLPYSKSITVTDVSEPTVNGKVIRNKDNNTLIVNFSKKMAVSGDGSVIETGKYLYKEATGSWKKLPTGSSVNVSPDGKSAIIQLPTSEIKVEAITDLRVQLVKDDKDNYLVGLTQDVAVENQTAVIYEKAEATDKNKISVKFSRSLLENTVNVNDFIVKSGNTTLNVISAKLDKTGEKVELTLADSNLLNDDATYGTTSVSGVTVEVRQNATTSTVDGTKVTANTHPVGDKVSAEVKSVKSFTNGGGFDVTFGEALLPTTSNDAAGDFIITNSDDKTLVQGIDYTLATAGSVAKITFTNPKAKGVYTVSLNPRFIKDASANQNLVKEVAKADAFEVYVVEGTISAPVLTTETKKPGTAISITAVPTGMTAWLAPTGTTNFVAGTTMTTAPAAATSILAPATDGVYKLFLVDANGIVSPESTGTLTVDGTVAAPTEAGTPVNGTTVSADFDITVNAETAGKVTATIGGVNVLKSGTEVTAAAGKAVLPIDITKLSTGANDIVITVTDAVGNVSTPLTVSVTK